MTILEQRFLDQVPTILRDLVSSVEKLSSMLDQLVKTVDLTLNDDEK